MPAAKTSMQLRALCEVIAPALLLGLVLANHAAAQPLSVDDCIGIALQSNPRLVASACARQAAQLHGQEARAARLPLVSLRGGASYAPLEGYDPALTEGGELLARLEVEQRLYDGGATRLLVDEADVGMQQASAEEARTVAELTLDVRLAFVELLAAERRTKLLQQSLEDLQSYLGIVRALASGGAVPKSDVTRVEIQLQSAALGLEDQRTAVGEARAQLLELLARPLDAPIAIQDTLRLPEWSPTGIATDVPELQVATLGVRAAELDIRAARAERLPVVALQGSFGAWTGRNQLVEASAPHVLGFQAGVAVEMPIWNWGAAAARVQRQSAALGGLQADYRVLQRHLEGQYRSALSEHEAALRKMQRLDDNQERASELYESLVAQYAGGGTTSLEVLDAHRAVVETALQSLEASADADRSQARLLRLVGEVR